MAVDTTKARLGPCEVFKGASPVTTGGTLGGVTFNIEQEFAPIMFDQTGTKSVSEVQVGFEPSFDVPLGEYGGLSKWLIPLVGSSVTGSTHTAIKFNGNIGQDAQRDTLYAPWTLKPYRAGTVDTDETEYVTLLRGFPMATKISAKYGTKDQRTLGVNVVGLPDPTDSNNRLCLGYTTTT